MKTRLLFAVALTAAFALGGCGSSESSPAGQWGDPDAATTPNLLIAEDGTVTGSDGCNNLSGTWTSEDSAIEFHNIASTLMACEDVDTWLSGATGATVEGDTLTLVDSEGATIGTLAREEG